MKKVILLGITSALGTMLLVGCGAAEVGPESHTGDIHSESHIHLTQKKVHNIIKEAAQDAGWKITEFKYNAMIAEKINDNESKSVTITFDKDSFDISPENSDLADTLNSALNK
jgi:outer membrane protein OmpA-like peptidoglycan-associated protein